MGHECAQDGCNVTCRSFKAHLKWKYEPHPLSNKLAVVLALGQWSPLQRENRLTARNGGPTCIWPEHHFLSSFVQRRREMAHPVLAKGFLRLSPEAAMLPGPRVESHPPPPVPPFLLAQNLSPKDIAGSDIASCMTHICVYRV